MNGSCQPPIAASAAITGKAMTNAELEALIRMLIGAPRSAGAK